MKNDARCWRCRKLCRERNKLVRKIAYTFLAISAFFFSGCVGGSQYGSVLIDFYEGGNRVCTYSYPIDTKAEFDRLEFLFKTARIIEDNERSMRYPGAMFDYFGDNGNRMKIALTDAEGRVVISERFRSRFTQRFAGCGALRNDSSFIAEDGLLVYELKTRLELMVLSAPYSKSRCCIDQFGLRLEVNDRYLNKTQEDRLRFDLADALLTAEQAKRDAEESLRWKMLADRSLLRLFLGDELEAPVDLFEEQKALTGTPAPNEVAAVAVPVGSCGGINVDIYNGANKIFNYVCPIEKKKDYARLLFLFNELERLEQTEMKKARNSSLCTRFKTPMGRWFKITLTDATGVKKKEHGFSLKVSGRFVGDGTLRDEASFTREEGLLVYELKNRLELALLSIPQAERYFRVDRTRLCLADGSDPKKTVEEYDREAIEKSLQNAENTDEEESEIWKRRAEYLKLRLLIEEESI